MTEIGTSLPPRPTRRRVPPPIRHLRSWVGREILALLLVVGLPSLIDVSVFGLSQLRLSEVAIDGTLQRVQRAWIEEQLAPFRGSHLLFLSLPVVQQRLETHPWVAVVELRKELPYRLRLSVQERRPAALLARSGRIEVLDATGRAIAPLRAGEEDLVGSLPLVRLASPEQLGTALAVARAAAARAGLGGVKTLAMGTERSCAVQFGALPFPVTLDPGDLAGSFRRLNLVLPEVRRRYRQPAGLDVSFPREAFLSLEIAGTEAGESSWSLADPNVSR